MRAVRGAVCTALLVAGGYAATETGDDYDLLRPFRTEEVTQRLDPAKLEGEWYEVAFTDVAQAGTSCQHLNNKIDATSGVMSEEFSVKYGFIPYTMNLVLEPLQGEVGLYKKYNKGEEFLLTLPTAVVDVVEGADGRYSLYTDMSIKTLIGGLKVQELRFLSRESTVTDQVLEQMKGVLAALGVSSDTLASVSKSDLSKCGFEAPQQDKEEQPAAAYEDGSVLVLKPSFTTGRQASLVMLIGMQVANTAYQTLFEKLQESAASRGISLFVGIPGYAGNLPQPVDLKYRVEDALAKLVQAGMDASAPAFYAGHSLGTVFMQDYVQSIGDKAAGQILMGGFLARKHFSPDFSYPVPTLTLAGELDGLARVTRMAESFYHQRNQQQDFPLVVFLGQNHMQFASGAPPSNVQKNDLPAEVDEATAHGNIAEVAADFIAGRLGVSGVGAALQARAADTEAFLQPLLDAYLLEGSRRFAAPAQVGGTLESECVRGLCPSKSPWAPTAQQLISTLPDFDLDISNAFVQLSGMPITGQDFHLPNVTRSGNTLSITTYSQCYWNDAIDEVLEDFDTGFTFTSAQEIGTKLLSRQCTMNVGAGMSVDFSVDDPDFCAQTNQKAYEWALQHAPAHSLERFQTSGIPLVMGADIQKEGGPLWLDARLQFNTKEQDGKTVVEVASPAQKTEQDYWAKHFPFPRPSNIPDPGCYHYCKLLSPARALEWILVDGLRGGSAAQALYV